MNERTELGIATPLHAGIALFFGFGTIAVGEQGKPFAQFVESANAVSMYIMDAIIKLSPIGVFCLITPVVAENGPKVLGDLAMVLAVAYIAYIILREFA